MPRRTRRLACSGSARAEVSTSPFCQYRLFGSRKITGSAEAIASWIIQYASFGVDGLTTRRPGVCAKYASGLSWWCSTAPMCPPYGMRITTGMLTRALVAVRDLGELRGDLVERGEDEPVELDLAHRPEPAHREADRGADDAGLGQRRVEHALLAELGLQPLGDAEHPAELADVFAHEQHAVVLGHRAPQSGVERAAEGHRLDRRTHLGRLFVLDGAALNGLGHDAPSSNEASYPASHARCSSISGWGSL